MSALVRIEAKVPAVPSEATPARSLNIAEAREQFTDLVNGVAYGGERLILMRRGKQLAALVPISDLDTLQTIPVQGAGVVEVRQSPNDTFTITVPNGGSALADSGEK